MQVAVAPKPNKHPLLVGFYVNPSDRQKVLSCRNLSVSQILERISLLRDMRPVGLKKWGKAFRTTPSIQGGWEMGQILDRPHRIIRA